MFFWRIRFKFCKIRWKQAARTSKTAFWQVSTTALPVTLHTHTGRLSRILKLTIGRAPCPVPWKHSKRPLALTLRTQRTVPPALPKPARRRTVRRQAVILRAGPTPLDWRRPCAPAVLLSTLAEREFLLWYDS